MIVLMGFTIGRVLLGALCVSLAVLLLTIAYRKLLTHLGKGAPSSEDFCVLYGLETHPAKGEVEFYFTTNSKRDITLELLNDDLSNHSIIQSKNAAVGGHIIRFNTETIQNGTYFYQLRTENQKTMKRFTIEN
jgi:hypothetical protein